MSDFSHQHFLMDLENRLEQNSINLNLTSLIKQTCTCTYYKIRHGCPQGVGQSRRSSGLRKIPPKYCLHVGSLFLHVGGLFPPYVGPFLFYCGFFWPCPPLITKMSAGAHVMRRVNQL